MNRLMEIVTPLGPDLLFRQMSGEESLGRLFEYRVDLLSPKPDVDPAELLGQTVTVKLEQPDGEPRFFNGLVARFAQSGYNGRYYTSQATLRPWLWLLTRKTDCRIFQNKTVPEILKAVFKDYPDFPEPVFKLTDANYRKWEYCVQYRESDFNFVSRLMEHEGIYYYFKHSESQHEMVLVDAFRTHKETPGFEALPYYAEGQRARPGVEYVHQWQHAQEIRSGHYSTTDYDFKLPDNKIEATMPNVAPPALFEAEVFDYPGGYIKGDPDGKQYAEVRLDELQTAFEGASGACNARTVHVGALFNLTHHPRAQQNAQYLVTRASFQMSLNAYEADGGEGSRFGCSFSVIPAGQQFRPRRSTPKPVVQGPQTAVVVGPAGDEIHVDKFGRVKVHFFWDRHDKKDENSSCWIRVSQPWAGKNWGMVAIPRIKQEVIVDFLEGDPDQPIITGRVYNGDQMPPYDLPANMTQTGIKTRSSKEGTPANFNEIRFEDKKGSEQLFIHAEKNQDIEVEADETHWVGHDRKKTVDNDENVEVKNNRTEVVGVDETITIGSNRTEDVGVDETITIGANRTESVGADETIDIGANRTETVAANESVTIGASRTLDVGASESITIGASRTETISGSLDQTVIGGINITTPAAMKVTATGGVTFTAPGGFTVIAPGGTKTIDSWFTSIGGKDEDLFSVSTSINTMANSISISNNAYAAFKIDTVSVLMEAVAIKNAVDSVSIQAAATEIKSGAIALYKKAMTLIG